MGGCGGCGGYASGVIVMGINSSKRSKAYIPFQGLRSLFHGLRSGERPGISGTGWPKVTSWLSSGAERKRWYVTSKRSNPLCLPGLKYQWNFRPMMHDARIRSRRGAGQLPRGRRVSGELENRDKTVMWRWSSVAHSMTSLSPDFRRFNSSTSKLSSSSKAP